VHADITVSGVREEGVLVGYAGVVVDVTEQVQAQEQLRALIDTMLDPWVLMEALRDADGRIVDFVYRDANSAACAYNGVAHGDLVGLTLLELLPAHLDSGLLAQYAEVVETGVPLVLDDSPFPADGAEGVRYFDNRGVKAGDGISFTWRDVTDRVERRKALAALARQDPLTGLANRTGLLEGIEAAFRREARQGEHVAVLYCDVDGLKAVNDGFGHRVGDHLLRAVADRMTGAVRRDDIVARIGGDEFVVVAVGVTDDEAALSLAAKLAEAVSRPLAVDGTSLLPRISIGVAMARPGQNPEDVLAAADRALYRQKKPAEVIALPLPRSVAPDDDAAQDRPPAP
jgi:diguanylate cyclase (GGDEF)-like protein